MHDYLVYHLDLASSLTRLRETSHLGPSGKAVPVAQRFRISLHIMLN